MDWLTGGTAGEAKRLIAQLADPSKRDNATRRLIRLGADAVAPLLETLQTRDESLLPIYQQILAQIPSASPFLIKLLTNAHPAIRGRVAEVFAIRKDRTAIPVLLEALRSEYYTVRSRAALALGNIGDKIAIAPLLNLLKDREDEVRSAACLALGKFNDPATFDEITNVLLDDSNIEVRQAAARALGGTRHPKAVPFLMEALRDPFWWYEREQAAGDLLSAIEQMGRFAVEPLLDALQDKEGAVRKFAAILLGRIGDPRAIESLGMGLYDLHHEVGNASAQALARFGEAGVGLLSDACNHPEAWIRIHAVAALAAIDVSQVTPILIRMLGDTEREVQKLTVRALGARKDPRAIQPLEAIAASREDRELGALAKDAINQINIT